MIRLVKIFFLLSLLNTLNFSLASAQSIAASLSKYQKSFETNIAGIAGTSISGVTFHPGSKTLYVVDDANTTVFEISLSGILVRSITLSGFEDTEGIAYQYGDYFLLVEERLANVVRARMPQNGSGPVSHDSCMVLNLGPDMGNSGMEDVAYTATPPMVYAVKEMSPPRLYRVTLAGNGDPAGFFENDPFNIETISGDAAGLFVLSDGNFLILSQEENTLKGYSATGTKLSELSLSMTKPEGITVDQSDSTIYIVGEPRQLFVFKNTANAIHTKRPGTTSFKLHACHALQEKTITVSYSLGSAEHVQIELFSCNGKYLHTLINKKLGSGIHRHTFKVQELPAGAYLCTINAGVCNGVSKIFLW